MFALSRLVTALSAVLLALCLLSPATAVPDRGAVNPTPTTNGSHGSRNHNPTAMAGDRPGVPEWIFIPEARVSAPVQPVRRDGRELAIPSNPRETGWDATTARPGARMGTTLISGHRDTSSHQTGALRWIETLDRGDTIKVFTRTGTVTYRVTSVVNYRQRGLPASVVNPVGWHRLALVTCGGPLVPRLDSDGVVRNHYRDNVVVWARPAR